MNGIQSQILADGITEFATGYMPARNLAARTREAYQQDVSELALFLEERGITDWTVVGLRDLNHFLADLERRGLAPSSRNRKAHAIKTFFKHLHRVDLLKDDPARGLIPPTVPRKEVRVLTADEYRSLLTQANNVRDRAILVLFLQTGMRLTEVATLSLLDLDLPKRITKEEVGEVKLRRKGATEQTIYIDSKTCEALSAWLKGRERMLAGHEAHPDSLFIN